ncbi:SDR family oxidoreductase [Allonocardiopsis opalescens]|uniref:Uncharacterized protein YbjT (DUF2867 family) n=1 Tax=Allonocardiopsis opalescens TaxID=1144618 RepID=A0A2T0PZX8_9ACTN|nr:SDR family oxidoreductase [Allonocardiopsis opalescens]PRX97088.1 uncharacterized protein YbjT (DUF2867 family) [Allonocardiopsis opalescens]
MTSPVTVVGGAGRTGRLIVADLLAQGVEVRVVSRRAGRAADLRSRGVATFDADVRDGRGLDAALAGSAGVVYLVEPGTANSGPDRPETTLYQGVRNVLAACSPQLERFVLVSSIYVTRPDHYFNEWGRLLDWRLRGEDAVRASGFPYTVVRPSWLTDEPAGRAGVRLERGDRGDGKISRSDVAQACVHALSSPAAVGLTFEMYTDPGVAREPWEALFAGLAKEPAPGG